MDGIQAIAEAMRLANKALREAESECRFHGSNFDVLGFCNGEPRCDSCRQPWRVRQALDAINFVRQF